MKPSYIYNTFYLIALVLLGFVSSYAIPVYAALPTGFEIETVASNLNIPTGFAFTPDGRIFVAEKGGGVRVIKNGLLLDTPLVTLSDVNTYGDRGLLGIAVDPNFANNGYIYLMYTYENTPGFNFAASKTGRIVRLTVVGDLANESSKFVLVGSVGGNVANPSCDNYVVGTDCIPSDSPSHTVAALRFGPDGKLYASIGDGSSFDYADPRSLRSQNIDSFSGKVIRINTDGTAPVDNPFYNGNPNSVRSKVFALGLRNPFRFSFRPSNGAIFAGDVGWSNWEEVNVITPGANYGWPCKEGSTTTVNGLGCVASTTPTDPLYFYAHDVNGAGSVTGGSFPTGSAYPSSFLNSYFFGDYAQNFIKRIVVDANNNLLSVENFATGVDGIDGPVDFVTAPDGNIYFIGIYTGTLKRITHTLGNRQPNVVISATPTAGLTPLTVSFSSQGSSDPDGNQLSFLWNFGDGATSSASTTQHVYTTAGNFNATLQAIDGQGGSSIKSSTITAGNQVPVATISQPSSGDLYTPGEIIQLSGSGFDPETGNLPGSSLEWQIIIHHNIHTHLFQTIVGSNGSFVGPDHSDPDVYVELKLTVTDPAGLKDTKSVNLYLNNGTNAANPILNPSLEIPTAGNANLPENWLKGGYGVNNAIFSYPVAGYDGVSAAKVEINNYIDGDAKWLFSPVYVEDNTEYNFSNYYTSNTASQVTVQIGYVDGTYSYMQLGVLDPSPLWQKFQAAFTTPPNARTLTVFHSIASIGQVTVDAYNLTKNVALDTAAPQITLGAPTTGSTVSGTINLSATATDNVGIAGVTFLINGTATGTEITTAPYQLSFDTTKLANGTYTFAARARDAVGNSSTTQNATVTISNVSPVTSTNMIINGALETVSTTTATRPYAWKTGKFGTNQTSFTYPVAGQSGNGVRVAMTQYTSGDAKWYFNDISVTPGQIYDLTLSYQSNATTSISLRYLLTSGTYQYVTLTGSAAPSALWRQMSYRFTVPAGVTSLTVFQALNRVGYVSSDEFTLRLVDAVSPVVAITAPQASSTLSTTTLLSATATDAGGIATVNFMVDGALVYSATNTPFATYFDTVSVVNGAHTLTVVARDVNGNTATATTNFIVQNATTTTTTNLISNGSMELADGQLPVGWIGGGFGNNTRTFTYPVVGHDNGKASQLVVTNYTDGDAKLVFTPVAVTPGLVYEYSDWYTSNTISDVIGAYRMSDGSSYYVGLIKEVAPTSTWTKISGRFSPPVGAVSLTIFHLISFNGILTLDDASLSLVGTTTAVTDTIAPIVAITAPIASSTISGSVTLTASSSDNVGVTHILFAIDGTPISQPITTSPYTFVWDTRTVSNGLHTIKATTHDAVGNNNTHTISVTVSNSATTTASSTNNLVENPSVEVSGLNNNPDQWFRGGWGTNVSNFSYPVLGKDSAKGIKVSITNYTDGDAKWYFAPKAVIPGNSYAYSHWYTADATSSIVARYTKSDGTYQYVEVQTLSPQVNWTKFSTNLQIPAGVQFVTIFHSLRSVGTLTTDGFELVPQTVMSDPSLFNEGMVSLTFDDGWLSHYTNVLPILNTANLKGSFGIVSLETLDALPVNRVNNNSFELETNSLPVDWNVGGWGTNNAVYTFDTTGRTGSRSAKISITSYVDGDAKWYFNDTTVIDGQRYNFSDYYLSDVPTAVTARYNMGGGIYLYEELGTAPAAATWTKFERELIMPANVESFTVFHRLANIGTLTIDDASLERVQIFVSPAQVLSMQSGGHEIASHSRRHPSLPVLTQSELIDEVVNSKTDLLGFGINKVNTFVYPYGDYTPAVETALQNAGYIAARSVDRGYNLKTTNKYELKTQQVQSNTTLDDIKNWIDTAIQNKTWLTLMFHQVDSSGQVLSTTPEILQGTVDYLKIKNTPVVTLEEGTAQMNP